MTSWSFAPGADPAIINGPLSVVLHGAYATDVARTLLPVVTAAPTLDAALDTLLSRGIAYAPSFALCLLRDSSLTAIVRGDLAVRVVSGHNTIQLLDSQSTHTWAEASFANVQQFAVAPGASFVDYQPQPALAAQSDLAGLHSVGLLSATVSAAEPTVSAADLASATLPFADDAVADLLPNVTIAPAAEQPANSEPTIPAVICENGHPNPPERQVCSLCGTALTGLQLARVVRPTLGQMTLPDGSNLALTGAIILGRNPRAPRVDGAHIPHLVSIDGTGHDVSRTHARITLEGWRVLIEDLGSTNGTLLIAPDGTSRRIRSGEPALISDGAIADLGGARIRFTGVP